MRRFKLQAHANERLDETSPHDRLVTAIDAALAFASTRELFTGEQVRSMLDMVSLVSVPDPRNAANGPLDDIASAFGQRALVASGERGRRPARPRVTGSVSTRPRTRGGPRGFA